MPAQSRKWKFVQLKILKIKSEDPKEDFKLMVQIIDISHRMLYKEIKSE